VHVPDDEHKGTLLLKMYTGAWNSVLTVRM